MTRCNKLDKLLLTACLIGILTSGCDNLRDWWNRDNPLPTTPIAPAAKPAPKVYTQQQAQTEMTNALIFALSMRSEESVPQVLFNVHDPVLCRICVELLRNRVIAQQSENVCYLLSRRTENGEWNIVLQSRDGREILLNKTLKVKDGTHDIR